MNRRVIVVLFPLVLTCVAVCVAQDERREIAFPDIAGCKTLKCDFHQHTVFSDGSVWPTVRIAEAWRQGLDAVVLSDHVEYQPHKKDVSTELGRSHELATDAAKQAGLLLIRGAEITRETPPGHFNALFLDDAAPLKTPEFLDAVAAAAKQQAFIFWSHQAWQGEERGRWLDVHTTIFQRKWLHGMEVCNGDSYYPEAHRWALEKNLTLLGNSDIHDPDLRTQSLPANHRTMTLVFAKNPGAAALREALAQRRTAVWYKDQIIGRKEWLQPLLAGSMRVEPIHCRTKESVWLRIRNTSDVDIRLERDGSATSGEKTLLPARSTSLVQFSLKNAAQSAAASGVKDGAGPVARTFIAANFLIAPGRGLPVTIAATEPK
jgi:hypothetical protein